MQRPGRKGANAHLRPKVGIFSVAAVLALAGMYFDERWMTGTALALLASSVLLRFLPTGADEDQDDDEEAVSGM